MITLTKRIVVLLFVTALMAVVGVGCNTAHGFGKDMERAGDKIQEGTKEPLHTVSAEAKRQGIARVHGFFLVGSPDETEADILESFRFAARLELDTFGFNRLCVYRGTPLWQEYAARGILDDERDWHKWFKCSDIDPTTLPGAVVNRLRAKGYGLLFLHRIFKRPIRTWKLLRAFGRHMKTSDIFKLLYSPFRRKVEQ